MRWLRRLLRIEKRRDIEDEESERWLQDLENVAMGLQGNASVVRALVSFARIQMALARRAHNQTRRVIGLTWAIVLLTIVLLLFTVFLAEDAYFNHQRSDAEQGHQSKPCQTGCEIQLIDRY